MSDKLPTIEDATPRQQAYALVALINTDVRTDIASQITGDKSHRETTITLEHYTRLITRLMDKREIEGQIKLIDELINYADAYLEWDDINGFSEKVMTKKIIKEKRKLEQQLKSLNSNEEN